MSTAATSTPVRGPLALDPADHRRHPMHVGERDWPQTNCSLDLWIELLHSLGHDPTPLGACALAADLRGDQWLFLKFPLEDIERLTGVVVDELALWRPALDHVVAHLAAGRWLTVEVDGWFLPDTAGVSYRTQHTKTTIVANLVDRAARRMQYFHNDGYFELAGDDFDGVWRLGEHAGADTLGPYVEVVQPGARAPTADPVALARRLAITHLGRRAPGNPIERLAARVDADLPWLTQQPLETFHEYAFALVRQCGASAQVAADFTGWLAARADTDDEGAGLRGAAASFAAVSAGAKTVQFQLARAARGRSVSTADGFAAMAAAWDDAMTALAEQARRWPT